MKRRMFIRGAAGAAIGMLAGCSETEEDTQNTGQTTESAASTDTRTSTDTATNTQAQTQTEEAETTTSSVETTTAEETATPNEVSTLGISDLANEDQGEELAQHLRQTSNWDMDIYDYRGQDTVTIQVGKNDNGEAVFDPPAIAIDPGTTVKWEWAGDGEYNIYTGGVPDFTTASTSEAGVHTEMTFEREVLRLYSCTNHDNMAGVIVIGGIEEDT